MNREQAPPEVVVPSLGVEVNLFNVGIVLLNHWRRLMFIPFAATILAVIVALLLPVRYTATTTLVPETGADGAQAAGGLAGLASQFGVTLSAGIESPFLYLDILGSRTLKDQLLQTMFEVPSAPWGSEPTTLLDLLEIEGDSLLERLELGGRLLQKLTNQEIDFESNVIIITVRTPYAVLSAAVANTYVEMLNQFNLQVRQSHARTRRIFVAQRLDAAEVELRQSENSQQVFLQNNRQYQQSPELVFEYDRLQRRVRIKEEVLTTLSRQFEEVRIQEINDAPLLTVVDRAVPPVLKSSPKRTVIVVVTFFVAGLMAIFSVTVREYLDRARMARDPVFDHLQHRWVAERARIRAAILFRRMDRGQDDHPVPVAPTEMDPVDRSNL